MQVIVTGTDIDEDCITSTHENFDGQSSEQRIQGEFYVGNLIDDTGTSGKESAQRNMIWS